MLRQNTRRLALAVALSAASGHAYAFGLGAIKVQSYLGQPLHAEIEVTQITADEASSLKVGVASPSAFQAAKLHYSSVLSTVQVSLERRPDGSAYLRLVSSSPVSEPFLDLLIRAQWSSGQISRDYTLLLDPPNFQPAPAAAQVPVQTGPAAQPAPSLQVPAAAPAPKPEVATSAPAASPAPTSGTYVVKKGDTLGRIAGDAAPQTVSLDQMLTAIYRANESAFINHNMNLLKAGAVLQIPSAAQARQIPQSEARRVVVAQSESFNAYRRRLAEMTAQARPETAGSQREASGKVQAQVKEPASAGTGPQSKLELSKAEVAGKAGNAPQQIAEQEQRRADAQRNQQLQKNVAELAALSKQAQSAVATAGHAPQAAAASKPASPLALPVKGPAQSAASAPGQAASKPAASAASAPAASAASAPAASAASAARPAASAAAQPAPVAPKPKAVPPAPQPQPSESFLDSLLANPMLLPAGGGLAILLLLLAWLARRKRQSKSGRDVSVFDSRMSVADSFFGGTGGERVDTRNSTMASTFSSSQIDTNDVDPVAEADVYLAYGRDIQAEEILKEAVKANPDRNAARLKLLEIYAKRKDSRSFEVGAAELFALTQGVGDDWKRAQDLGRGLDPANPLYHNTVPPSLAAGPSTRPQAEFPAPTPTALAALNPQTLPSTEMLSGLEAGAAKPAMPEHLDLDLDLPGLTAAPAAPSAGRAAAPSPAAPDLPSIDLPVAKASAAPATSAAPAVGTKPKADDFSNSGLEFEVPPDFAAPSPSAAAMPAMRQEQRSPLEFDLSGISLHEPETRPVPAEVPHAGQPDFAASQPLDVRFELASESLAIGDVEAARNLLGEIAAEGDPGLKARAREMLDKIGH